MLLAFLLVLAQGSIAAIFLVEPVDQMLESNDTVAFGKVAAGETLRVIVEKKSGLAAEWNEISVNQLLLPAGWSAKSIETDKTLIAEISLPRKAEVSTQRIEFTVSNKASPLFSETFYGGVSVRDGLLTVSIDNLDQGVVVGHTASFRLTASNDSIAPHAISVESSLPRYWFSPISVSVPAGGKSELDLNVDALAYGKRGFIFKVKSELNDESSSFPASLEVSPTLRGKFFSGLVGFPFFSPSLFSQYLLIGFLAVLS
ncbi:MAG: hypothetical protein JW744_02300 [Candidatus Diapherotrites archaeon]|uniref:Uncharacterized protein n=1 Tax=Candidatus Iainarchaeum sp. TaxID=3101447 RepID=A0A938YUA5_9ARCH|nr:hypothetical protein [Candidatus Diapherotrites archaeon]